MADNARAKRLADLIREVVAQKLQRGIKDPRLGSNVTITDTRVTGDLREATVFYTVTDRRYFRTFECMSNARWIVPSCGEMPMQMTLCESVDVVR